MTAILCTALALLGPPCSRGGHAGPSDERGGRAVAWSPISRDLERLGVDRVRDLRRFDEWICIHRHEAAWTDVGDPYWGGLQMDRGFMRAYGPDVMRRHRGGFADEWTPAEQIVVAERAYASRGYGPWPNTARACGLSLAAPV